MREPWLVLVPTWARADGLCGTPDMSPALNYKALLYATPTHLPSICPFPRPRVIISALSMYPPPVLWAWIRAPATHFLGSRILTTLPLSIPPAAFSALPQHLPSPFSVIVLSSQYLFQRGPIWIGLIYHLPNINLIHEWGYVCSGCLVCALTSDQCCRIPGADPVTMIWVAAKQSWAWAAPLHTKPVFAKQPPWSHLA